MTYIKMCVYVFYIYIYICIHDIFITKEEILMTITVLISGGGHMVMTGIYNYLFFNTHSVFALSSASTLAIHCSLPTGGTQIFILKGSGPLLILPRLNCSFYWP